MWLLMYRALVFWGANSWKNVCTSDSFQECLDEALRCYLFRKKDFRFVEILDRFNNTPFRIDKYGTIDQYLVNWN